MVPFIENADAISVQLAEIIAVYVKTDAEHIKEATGISQFVEGSHASRRLWTLLMI